MKTILVAAFEPFNGETLNPSQEVARELEGTGRGGVFIESVVLPVARFAATQRALEVLHNTRPDAVVMLGEAGGRTGVTPERVALNVDDYRIPDASGLQPRGETVVASGPAAYFTTLPLEAIVAALRLAGIPSEISNTAGTYLCNRLFYAVRHWVETEMPGVPAGFVHLPYLPAQAARQERPHPSLALPLAVEAVRIICDTIFASNV